jgi:hypothetical protein
MWMHAIWQAWEHLFHFLMRVQPIRPGEAHLFLLSVRPYMGRPIEVDGITVKRFDPIIELHMNNDLLAQVLREADGLVGLAVRLLQIAKRDLPLLAERVAGEEFARAKVLMGTTFIHRSVERFGFHVMNVDNVVWRTIVKWHLRNVFRMVNPNAAEFFHTHADEFVPKLVAISKDKLICQFAAGADR